MKFGKLLQSTTLDLTPESSNLLLRYKQLKKQLKSIQRAPGTSESDKSDAKAGDFKARSTILSEEEKKFINTLNEDLAKFNQFFMDKEEDSVIRMQVLAEEIQKAPAPEELRKLVTQLVDFHGEMVLLLHWSFLNYAAVVKILKKHDKHTGLFLRAPYVATLLQQPFFSTSVLTRLVKQTEEHIQQLVRTLGLPDQHLCEVPSTSEATADDGDLLRRTKSALEVWRQLSATAATPSTVLPSDTLRKLADCQEIQAVFKRQWSHEKLHEQDKQENGSHEKNGESEPVEEEEGPSTKKQKVETS